MVKQHIAVNTQPDSESKRATHDDISLEEMAQRAIGAFGTTLMLLAKLTSQHVKQPSSPALTEKNCFSFSYLKIHVVSNSVQFPSLQH